MSSKDEKRIDWRTERQAGKFLFDMEGMSESQGLDMRTRIVSKEVMSAVWFYGILWETLSCESARDIVNLIKRTLIARKGLGRAEGVTVLKQQFPKIREVAKGVGDDYKDYEEEALASVENIEA